MFRLILILLFLTLSLILYLPVLLVCTILNKFNIDTSFFIQRLSCNILKIIGHITLAKVKYIGLSNIPKNEPVLYILNHQSFFDVIFTYPKFTLKTGYIAKVEMLKVPIIPTIMKKMHCLFIDRDNPKEAVRLILRAIDMIKSNISIAICPEGTRNLSNNPNKINEFKKGAFKIAEKTNCLIQPIAIANTGYILEQQYPNISSKRPIIIEFLKPIRLSELPKDADVARYFQDIIQETINKNLDMYDKYNHLKKGL